jgi:AGCS family alanine or glycine:cation symporter
MEERIVSLADLVWGAGQLGGMVLSALLLGTGLYVTIRLGAPQLRHLGHAVALARGKLDRAADPGEVTHFQALCAALGGSLGIGNIAGVATAISFGGPGAVFWLWVAAVLGMATKLTECTLAVHFRERNEDGTWSGGPMHSIRNGLSRRLGWLAWVFAGFAAIASFGIGNMVPANTVAEQVFATTGSLLGFGVPRWATGLVMASLLAIVILGGIDRIARVATRLVPIMTLLYLLGGLAVLAVSWRDLPHAFATIVRSAFAGTAATGGFLGATVIHALRWGVARGAFSGEAGLGSSPIAHAAARTSEPIRQGLVSMLEPLVDGLVICTITALAIVSTGVWHERLEQDLPLGDVRVYERPVEEEGQATEPTNFVGGVVRVVRGDIQGTVFFFENRSTLEDVSIGLGDEEWSGALHFADGRLTGALEDTSDRGLERMADEDRTRLRLRGRALAGGPTLTAAAFDHAFPGGDIVVAAVLILFAFTTAVSWSYFGDRCVGFLFGVRAVLPYRMLFVLAHALGAVFAVRVVWAIADVASAAMALPSILSLWALAGLVAVMRRRYLAGEPAVGGSTAKAGPRRKRRKK